ncbi:hypothetical protein FOQG_00212 [Fusarium oxysporum f. sp. raphani 54005]|uniref:Uncharacterized protein n=1 Tax=Fusarium oxysporum f. sp. raphani 54005 TaxID=1089458 RepID=X0CZ72_FUSOX|nr:hypothetical protein FOQG_00212 [Fusarium oxysporum f. sp. raphani 54005]
MPLLNYTVLSTRTALENMTTLQDHRFQDPEFPEQNPSSKIVILNGFPGTGKLTILQNLKKFLPGGTTFLLDNHLLIDPVAAIIPDRSNRHHELRRNILILLEKVTLRSIGSIYVAKWIFLSTGSVLLSDGGAARPS